MLQPGGEKTVIFRAGANHYRVRSLLWWYFAMAKSYKRVVVTHQTSSTVLTRTKVSGDCSRYLQSFPTVAVALKVTSFRK